MKNFYARGVDTFFHEKNGFWNESILQGVIFQTEAILNCCFFCRHKLNSLPFELFYIIEYVPSTRRDDYWMRIWKKMVK